MLLQEDDGCFQNKYFMSTCHLFLLWLHLYAGSFVFRKFDVSKMQFFFSDDKSRLHSGILNLAFLKKNCLWNYTRDAVNNQRAKILRPFIHALAVEDVVQH